MPAAPRAASVWPSESAWRTADSHPKRGRQVQRLKTRHQFQAVLAGQTVARTAHFVLHMSGLDVSEPSPATATASPQPLFNRAEVWIGAMVPKRWARRAVTRNTIKRQIYGVSRLFEEVLPKAAHVVRLRAGFDRAQFKSAHSELLKKAVRAEIEQLFNAFTAARSKAAA